MLDGAIDYTLSLMRLEPHQSYQNCLSVSWLKIGNHGSDIQEL